MHTTIDEIAPDIFRLSTHVDEIEVFAWSAPFLGTTMTATHRLAPTSIGTRNTLTVDMTGRCAPIVGRLLRRPVGRAITTENEGFKAAAESRSV